MYRTLRSLCLLLLLGSCEKITSIKDLTGPEALHNREVGASAAELLQAGKYTALRVEMQYMPGFVPDAAAVESLKSFLEQRLHKPEGITVVYKEVPAAGKSTLTANELVSIEKERRTVFSSGNTIALYFLYTDGAASSGTTLGVAYRNTSAALFGKTLRDNSGGFGQVSRTKLESTVLQHEAGHLLGLVDLGTPMTTPHKDAAHGHHCDNDRCLMYWASETTDALGFLLTGSVPTLDAGCLADLRAGGGR